MRTLKELKAVEAALKRGLTVADLRRALEDFEDDAVVLFACDYGDYTHTTQALPVKELEGYTVGSLSETAYSGSGLALNDDEAYEEEDRDEREHELDEAGGGRPIVILR